MMNYYKEYYEHIKEKTGAENDSILKKINNGTITEIEITNYTETINKTIEYKKYLIENTNNIIEYIKYLTEYGLNEIYINKCDDIITRLQNSNVGDNIDSFGTELNEIIILLENEANKLENQIVRHKKLKRINEE